MANNKAAHMFHKNLDLKNVFFFFFALKLTNLHYYAVTLHYNSLVWSKAW